MTFHGFPSISDFEIEKHPEKMGLLLAIDPETQRSLAGEHGFELATRGTDLASSGAPKRSFRGWGISSTEIRSKRAQSSSDLTVLTECDETGHTVDGTAFGN